jgi:hypothetical protein
VNKNVVSSNNEQVTVTVHTVEILPNGTMRWDLSFRNSSTSDIYLNLGNETSYLADEYGNRYAVLDDSRGGGSTGLLRVTIQPGVRLDHSYIFDAPKHGAKQFTVGLVTISCCFAVFDPFEVRLDSSS